MDENFSEFLTSYNNHMRNIHEEQYLITKDEILKKIGEHYFNKVNIYDKIGVQFPTMKMFILEFYCKIYIEGKQIVLLKTIDCHKCKHNFSHNTSATFENNLIIHKSCETQTNNNNIPTMPIGTRCNICNEKCYDNIIMDNTNFLHKECCSTVIKKDISDWSCNICSEPLFPNMKKHKFDYCHLKGNKSHIAHVNCAKNDKKNKYVKTLAHVGFNKCGICGFYVLENKYMHDMCKNIN